MEQFVKRVDLCKQERGGLLNGLLLEKWEPDYSALLAAAPYWMPLTFSNRRLMPWQGAAMCVFENDAGEKLPLIQLRTRFKKGRLLSTSKEEVLLHEMVHALRAPFNEPRFEELLAYSLSSSKWRRCIAPLFRRPRDAALLLSFLLLSLLTQSLSLFFLSSFLLLLLPFMALLPFFYLLWLSAALVRDRRLFKRALCRLAARFPKARSPFAIALRLTDRELALLGKGKEIGEEDALRWRQIRAQFGKSA